MTTEAGGPAEPARGPGGKGLEPGVEFAGLVIEAEVGRGGMGVIFRVRDPALDRIRALKVLTSERSADPEFRERFRRESRQAAAIEHPNVIPVYRAGEESGQLYLVMRFVDGPSLTEVLAERGRLPLNEVLDLVTQVAAGLDAAHAVGLVHRDVKPGNILIEDGRAFLGDFGISKLAETGDALTSTGEFVGTVDYVAPEQVEGGEVDRRADVYSLACVAFRAASGERPFPRDTQLATMFAHANAPRPDPGPHMPSKVREALRRGMAIDPGERPASAGELAIALESAAGAESAATTKRLAILPRRVARSFLFVAGVAGLLAAVVAVVLLLGQDDGAPEAAPPFTSRLFEVPEGPLGVAVGTKRAWVTSPPAGRVTSIPLGDGARTEYPVGSAPVAVAIGFGSVWLVDRKQGDVVRIEPETGQILADVKVGDDPVGIAIGASSVWVANSGSDDVSRIDPEEGNERVTDTIPVAAHPSALAPAPRGVWVASRDADRVFFIDEDESAIAGLPIEAGARPNDLVLGGGRLWVSDNVSGEVARYDPDTREQIGEPVRVGALPRSIAFGLGYLWIANDQDDTVVRIDPATGEVVEEPIAVGAEPAGIAVGSHSVWVANSGDGTVTELVPKP